MKMFWQFRNKVIYSASETAARHPSALRCVLAVVCMSLELPLPKLVSLSILEPFGVKESLTVLTLFSNFFPRFEADFARDRPVFRQLGEVSMIHQANLSGWCDQISFAEKIAFEMTMVRPGLDLQPCFPANQHIRFYNDRFPPRKGPCRMSLSQ
jgi:hypothetical protein